MKTYKLLTLLGILLGSVIGAQAQGLLGTKHLSVTGGYSSAELDVLGTKIKSDSGYHFSARGNVPLLHADRSDVGMDLLVDVGYTRAEKSETALFLHYKGHLDNTTILTAVRPYVKLDENFRIFGQAGLGWAHSKLKVSFTNLQTGASGAGSISDDGFMWGLGAGAEVIIDAFAIQASATYVDMFSGSLESTWVFDVITNYWVNEQWGVGVAYSHRSADSSKIDIISGSVRFQF